MDKGIDKVEKMLMPLSTRIHYIISWQHSDEHNYILPKSLQRDDVKVYIQKGRGLSKNRNNALKYANSDICLISDDDIIYNQGNIDALLEFYSKHPEVDVVTYQFETTYNHKDYPTKVFNLKNKPPHFNISSIEISFRRVSVQGKVFFNELMGLGSPMAGAGEDDLFILDCLKEKLNCMYIPLVLSFHAGGTTGISSGGQTKVVFARGILNRIYHPYSFPIKYILVARSININHKVSFWTTLITLFRGGIYAKRNKMLKYKVKEIFNKNNGYS